MDLITTNFKSPAPTAQEVFGANPWVPAGGYGPTGEFPLNEQYFASQSTAEAVLAMFGSGMIVPVDTFAQTPGNPFHQNQPNLMIKFPPKGNFEATFINPGLVAGFFTHGYNLGMLQAMVQAELYRAGIEAKIVFAYAPNVVTPTKPASPVGRQYEDDGETRFEFSLGWTPGKTLGAAVHTNMGSGITDIVDGQEYNDPFFGVLVARVTYNSFVRVYNGYWAKK